MFAQPYDRQLPLCVESQPVSTAAVPSNIRTVGLAQLSRHLSVRNRRCLILLVDRRERPVDCHFAEPAMVCIEQTHNRLGGRVLSLEYMAALADWYVSPRHSPEGSEPILAVVL